MGITQSKKRSAVDAELDEAVDITANEPATAVMIDLNIATAAFAVPAASLGLEALSTAAIAEEARAMYEQVVETIDLSTPSAAAAAAAAATTDDEAAEQPIAVGNADSPVDEVVDWQKTVSAESDRHYEIAPPLSLIDSTNAPDDGKILDVEADAEAETDLAQAAAVAEKCGVTVAQMREQLTIACEQFQGSGLESYLKSSIGGKAKPSRVQTYYSRAVGLAFFAYEKVRIRFNHNF